MSSTFYDVVTHKKTGLPVVVISGHIFLVDTGCYDNLVFTDFEGLIKLDKRRKVNLAGYTGSDIAYRCKTFVLDKVTIFEPLYYSTSPIEGIVGVIGARSFLVQEFSLSLRKGEGHLKVPSATKQ